jgi:hypothetical protein
MRRESPPRFQRSGWDVTVTDAVDDETSAPVRSLPIPQIAIRLWEKLEHNSVFGIDRERASENVNCTAGDGSPQVPSLGPVNV